MDGRDEKGREGKEKKRRVKRNVSASQTICGKRSVFF